MVSRALGSENDDFVAGFDAGNLGHVEDRVVHADAADQRRALAADQKAEAVAEAAVEAVGVAGGDKRDAHGLGGHKGSVVADDGAGGNGADAHDRGLPGEHRLQVAARGRRALQARPDAKGGSKRGVTP